MKVSSGGKVSLRRTGVSCSGITVIEKYKFVGVKLIYILLERRFAEKTRLGGNLWSRYFIRMQNLFRLL